MSDQTKNRPTSAPTEFDQIQVDPLARRYLVPGSASYATGVDILPDAAHLVETALRHRPSSALVFGGPRAWKAAGHVVAESLATAGVQVLAQEFPGECSDEQAAAYAKLVRDNGLELIVGVGGGKVLDTAKCTGDLVNIPVVTVPTIASNCAAWTPLAVVYTPDGRRLRTQFFDHAPILTIVDYGVIAGAPLGYLLSGIGDTVVKWYEARLSASLLPGSSSISAGLALARVTWDELVTNSSGAARAVFDQVPTVELANAVDTIIPVSGLVGGVGGEATRVAIAHGFYNAWTIVNPEQHADHGLSVAFGLLVQLLLEGRHEELGRVRALFADLGLPLTLVDLGHHGNPEPRAAAVATEMARDAYLQRLELELDSTTLQQAIMHIDGLGRKSPIS